MYQDVNNDYPAPLDDDTIVGYCTYCKDPIIRGKPYVVDDVRLFHKNGQCEDTIKDYRMDDYDSDFEGE